MAIPQQPKRMTFDVTFDAQTNQWTGKREGNMVAKGPTKDAVVRRTIESAKQQSRASVRIHGQDGRIQEERTYPRESDPRSSRG